MQSGHSEDKDNSQDAASQLSPAALVDRRGDLHFLESYKKLLAETNISHDQLFVPVLADKRHLICPLTKRLMADPVITPHGRIVERDAYQENCDKKNSKEIPHFARKIQSRQAHQQPEKTIKPANDISKQIIVLISKHPDLKKIQYLPHAWIFDMADACQRGDVAKIRALYNKDSRLLLAPHPDSKWVPLQYAIQNEKSMDTMIELLDLQLQGLALVSVLRSDQSHQLPLENALRYGSLNVIQKLMAWMGSELDSFRLKNPLAEERQSTLDSLLQRCILQGNAAWARKALFWGANLQMTKDKVFTSEQQRLITELMTWSSDRWVDVFPMPINKVLSSHSAASEASPTSDSEASPSPRPRFNSNMIFAPADIGSELVGDAIELMYAIFNKRTRDVRTLLNENPQFATAQISTTRLLGLPQDKPATTLTGLQYASELNHQSVCMIIINKIGYSESEKQLGRQRVVELVGQTTPSGQQPPPRPPTRRM